MAMPKTNRHERQHSYDQTQTGKVRAEFVPHPELLDKNVVFFDRSAVERSRVKDLISLDDVDDFLGLQEINRVSV